MSIMALMPDDHGHGHIHGIVDDNMSIFGTKVHFFHAKQ
jgi:hypothetical protein